MSQCKKQEGLWDLHPLDVEEEGKWVGIDTQSTQITFVSRVTLIYAYLHTDHTKPLRCVCL